jgi:hypothetical protein
MTQQLVVVALATRQQLQVESGQGLGIPSAQREQYQFELTGGHGRFLVDS